jgi:prepilin-type N-terminal cleavage/methylation domain-containing protein
MGEIRGFSLVELSIVLVILGLLVGGILAGKSLIKASELRSVIKETDQIRTATMAFKDKYFYLPGDMPNALSVWPSNWWTDQGASLASTSTASEINGNGDGNTDWSYVGPADSDGQKFFAHLRAAGLMPGTPVVRANNQWCHPPVNVPASAFGSGGYYVTNDDGVNGWNNYIGLGKMTASANVCSVSLFTPEELWNLDQKMDDGAPGTGVVREIAAGCAPTTTTYALTTTTAQCRLYYIPKW